MPTEKQVAMRHAIAAAMARSKREIPHYYLGTQIDMSRAMAWLQAENLRRSVKDRLLYSVMLLKAVALALREVPEFNGFWVDGAFKRGDGNSRRGGDFVAPRRAYRAGDSRPRPEKPQRNHDRACAIW